MSNGSLLYGGGSHEGGFDLSVLFQSFLSPDFIIFVILYYAYYLMVTGIILSIAVFFFKIDYTSGISNKQLRREVLMTVESYTTTACCLWTYIQIAPHSWETTFEWKSVMGSYLINSFVFSLWFYISHKTWHSHRLIYNFVHSHHHESVLVCPLTALSNSWAESVWTVLGFFFAPYLLANMTSLPLWLRANNIVGWYGSIFSIVFEAILGHSRIPFTLEHASHHAVVTKNFGFFGDFSLRGPNWDRVFGTWTFSQAVQRVRKLYPREVQLFTWNEETPRTLHWEMIMAGAAKSKKFGEKEEEASSGMAPLVEADSDASMTSSSSDSDDGDHDDVSYYSAKPDKTLALPFRKRKSSRIPLKERAVFRAIKRLSVRRRDS